MSGALTVGELFGLSPFRDYHLVAGSDGLPNIVSSCTVMELVDGADWLKPGTVVLTVCSNFSDKPAEFTKWLESFYRVGVSAIVIKLGRFIDEVPVQSIEFANEAGLPLLIMPDDTRPDELLTTIHEFIYLSKRKPSINNLFSEIISPITEQDKEHLSYLSTSLGVDFKSPYHLLIIDIPGGDATTKSMGQSIFYCAKSYDKKTTLASMDKRALLLFHPIVEAAQGGGSVLSEMVSKLQGLVKAEGATIWVGPQVVGLESLRDAYGSLTRAIDFCRGSGALAPFKASSPEDLSGMAVFYEDLGYLGWLSDLAADRPAAEAFVKRHLTGALADFSPAKQRELIETLRVYLLHGGSLKAMSESIHIHKNTLIYRINSIEKAMGHNINQINTRANIFSAILLYTYFAERRIR